MCPEVTKDRQHEEAMTRVLHQRRVSPHKHTSPLHSHTHREHHDSKKQIAVHCYLTLSASYPYVMSDKAMSLWVNDSTLLLNE